ncbi:MAG: MBL fold metallo-hydrolase [Leptospira sp.]|nr:MBL fold metallo-hydrolase [Leptospira sp.]
MFRLFFFTAALLFSIYCGSNTVSLKPHHTQGGFKNIAPDFVPHGFGYFLRWQIWRIGADLPSLNPEDYKFERVENSGEDLRKNTAKLSVTWIGHATVLIQMDGKNILTDPIWSERCSPVSFAGPKRYTKPGVKIADLPKIDIVLLSHNHYDHMDAPTLIELEQKFKPHFFAGLKNRKFLKELGLSNVSEMDWWEEKSSNQIKVIFTPTQHFSSRSLIDGYQTLWGSFIVQSKNHTAFFAGDTGYFDGFKEIAEKFPGIDIAILPIGAYEPRWFMKPVHMSPEDAVQAFLDLNAKAMLPMHYATFVLTDEALDEPLILAKKAFVKNRLTADKLLDLKIGESKWIE